MILMNLYEMRYIARDIDFQKLEKIGMNIHKIGSRNQLALPLSKIGRNRERKKERKRDPRY